MTANKDYYAILMVHPKAATFLIEAAYKRLAREYHPDFGKVRNNHEKMIELNEAYEILSDPARRQRYDQEYARQRRIQQHDANVAQAQTTQQRNPAQSENQAKSAPKPADPKWGNICPIPPQPASFGIDAEYLERALAGVQAWKKREDRISDKVKWATRILGILVGVAASIALIRTQWWGQQKVAYYMWFVLPLLGELALRLIERIRDTHLLRYKFNPLYNPNAAGYYDYAEAYARYESDTVTVYVSRDSIYHANKACQGTLHYEPMPKWFAILKDAQPCRHCGRGLHRIPKRLPPPFGQRKFIGRYL